MSPPMAKQLGLNIQIDQVLAGVPDRAITPVEGDAANAALASLNLSLYVERGYRANPNETRGIWIVLGALTLIALAATVIVTALATSDNARDSSVLAAVGATVRLRRRWASWYAAITSGTGVLLGLVVGLGMGAACAWWTTGGTVIPADSLSFSSEIAASPGIAFLWPAIGILLVLPAVGAAIAYLSVRSSPRLLRHTV